MTAAAPFAAGHTDSALCLQLLPGGLLASGGEDGAVCLTDLSTLKPAGRIDASSYGDAVPSLCAHPSDERCLFAAAGTSVLHLDLRRSLGGPAALVHCYGANAEEVNSLAATAANGGWLAAGDDSGEVQLISLQPPSSSSSAAEADDAQAPQPQPQRPAAYKTLRRGHSNICAAVAFRPHRPWELLSGGLDSTVVKWDFSRLRPLHTWNLGVEATSSGGQLFNPPMVHSLAVPQCEERGLARLLAVGRGDGCVSLYDADHKPAAASSSGGGGGGKKGGSKAKPRGNGSGAGAKQQAAGAAAAAGPPGRLALLGPEQGGHTAAVNSVAFYPGGASCQHLLSAGNDRRLLLWNWGAAQAAAAAAAAVAEEAGEEGTNSSSSSSLRTGGAQEPEAAAAAADAAGEAAEGAGAAGGGGGGASLLVAEFRHGRKINCACPVDVPGCPYNVLLADTGRRLTALTLQL